MTDKQQIEKKIREMERIGSRRPCKNDDCSICLAMNRRCNDFLFAERLYNAGYRKVGENAVVLTREEFDRLNACIKSEEEVRAIMEQQMLPMVRQIAAKEMDKKLADITALVRKETAKEFAEGIIKMLWNRGRAADGKMFEYGDLTSIDVWELAKQYGVEVQDE